ncbi:MAG: alpha/beta fold hydrolase, partial [Elusimicrobiaceae bacterium]
KPFRNLAQGLAAQGIAVLRYDKRTFAHGMSLTPDILRSFTVKEETVDDAAAAVNFMRWRKEIDRSKVFVLGHSMGGSLIPRISSAAGGKCAGFIVFAGSAEPLEDAMVRQTAYLSALDGEITEEEKTAVEKAKADAARIKDPALSSDGPVIAGAAPAYWLDLRGYYPPDAAKKIGKPMFILQGERDYNVTMADFKNWQTALSSKTSVKFKSYPKLNHDFAEGKGSVTAEEYLKAANVASYVVDDIAGWIKAR